ncbi:hypothetical protein AVEN_59281-1 [Araneus ventricosus]|uniref:Uncharacterized protein n=1 Tax=Araneus ventricosus TaxID=182803 RepID=A0A4Y2I148_ARAVE|nr:hypothetical protein AVEN_59281-1 [Araneus ventricosus]
MNFYPVKLSTPEFWTRFWRKADNRLESSIYNNDPFCDHMENFSSLPGSGAGERLLFVSLPQGVLNNLRLPDIQTRVTSLLWPSIELINSFQKHNDQCVVGNEDYF